MPSELIIAIHVLAYLRKENKQLSSEEIAKNVCVNPVRIRKVLSQLKKAGIVETKEGINGGYCFKIGSEKINLKQVYDALKVKICYSKWRSGDVDNECMISSGMSFVVDDLCDELEKSCQEYLSTITIRDVLLKLEANAQERRQ